eukprot:TRINITY_DN30488_c0_g1_i1.p1 TRINITY_DN30488_c0_g1~~TRINITY_DN30488_c0_g1_i1.p1  ORF type:complete len:264 (+),score=42.35 TRINITY_DN30488_c0_g1_i1:44-835(+)
MSSSLQTPDEVIRFLRVAYDDLGTVGHDTAGHLVDGSQNGLMYGELLPGGVSKALDCMGAGSAACSGSTMLELGSGTGKVAVQAFLECANLSKIVAVELSSARSALAVAAAERLAKADGHRFSLHVAEDRRRVEVTEHQTGRQLTLIEGDLLAVEPELVAEAALVFVQVALPSQLYPDLQRLLQHATSGCVALLLPDLTDSWELDEGSCFHQEQVGTTFATSWAPQAGHHFHILRCNRDVPPSITRASAARIRAEAADDGHAL